MYKILKADQKAHSEEDSMIMKVNFVKKNADEVNKIIVEILWLLFAVSTILLFFQLIRLEVYGSFFLELSIATIFIRVKKFQTATIAVLFLAILTYTIPYIGTSYSGMVISSVLCIVSLYLNKAILYSFGSLYSISYIIIYYSNNHRIDRTFTTTLALTALTVVALYFVCKRSVDYIQLSIQKEAETKELLDSLNNMVHVIHENTTSLNDGISSCNRDISALRNQSHNISDNVNHVTDGISKQSESLFQINDMMEKAERYMQEISMISKNLAEISRNTNQIVEQGSDSMNQMEYQMRFISMTVSESVDTIKELNMSMDDVNNFLSEIKQISSQTNLLALNASIEAARAGEAGAGFTVVSNEIKKLAEQSSDTVGRIDKILSNIKDKTRHVSEKAANGNLAVQTGNTKLHQVLNSFENIEAAFHQIDQYIEDALKMTQKENDIFLHIQNQAQNISDISYKHVQAMEDMNQTIQEQNENVEIIYQSIGNIDSSSKKLQDLIEKRNDR